MTYEDNSKNVFIRFWVKKVYLYEIQHNNIILDEVILDTEQN